MNLPEDYQILPYSIPFVIPGFEKTYQPGDFVLSLTAQDSKIWFKQFVDKLEYAVLNRTFLPVCRMSDGEFMFCVGEKLPSKRIGLIKRVVFFLRRGISKVIKGNNFKANTLPNVPSGNYTQTERKLALNNYTANIKKISQIGILALDFTHWNKPFQEQYFRPFYTWINSKGIELTKDNYFPFYFVYATLLGPDAVKLLTGRSILVIHSAKGKKKQNIQDKLHQLGCTNIEWLEISADRSLYDTINMQDILSRPDIALIGAGVGKVNIMVQLEPLQIPLIDAGYVFEVWNNDDNKWKRRYCVEDTNYKEEKIDF